MSDFDSIRDRIDSVARGRFTGWSPDREAIAPGRIELIGGHLDYNGGPVLAAAIDKVIIARSQPNNDTGVRVCFADVDPDVCHEIDAATVGDFRLAGGAQSPADFLRGAIAALAGRGIPLVDGIDLIVGGNLPFGVGISSSAALCVALAQIVSAVEIDFSRLVLIAQEAENRTGSPCGTMDQSASVFGNVIEFDGATNNVRVLNPDLGDHMFVVANSGVVRNLATSVYPTRVRESKEALEIMRREIDPDLASLAALSGAKLPEAEEVLAGHSNLQGRVRHVVTETERVTEARSAATTGDWVQFGHLMTVAGESSSTDYGIGHPTVSTLVDAALAHPDVLGARIMGGGEGGAALLLVRRDSWSDIRSHMASSFYVPNGHFDLDVMLIPCRFAPGAKVTRIQD